MSEQQFRIPLYREGATAFIEGANALKGTAQVGNIGLLFDKFCDEWDKESWRLSDKRRWLTAMAERRVPHDPDSLDEALTRVIDLVDVQGGRWGIFTSESAFVTGLGRSHPVENGFAWHHTLGTPYLPGSSVKGLVRASLPRKEVPPGVTFLDVLPVQPVALAVDVITPHYAHWTEVNPPGDWQSPIPIPFLVVPRGTSWLFTILGARSQDADVLERIWTKLTEALRDNGAGAKVSLGFGRFAFDGPLTEARKERIRLRREEQAAKARLGRLTELAQDFLLAAQEERWDENRDAFVRAGLIESWLDQLEAAPDRDVLQKLEDLVRQHFPGLLENPDAVQGKRQKFVFHERQRAIARRLHSLRQRMDEKR